MGIKYLYNDDLRKLPDEYGDVSVMSDITGTPRQILTMIVWNGVVY